MSRDPEYGASLPPRFLVPLTLLAAAFVAAWSLARWAPGPALPEWSRWAATVVGALGVLSVVAGVTRFARGGTSVEPFTRADALLTGGVYRFSRNPIYLGHVLLVLAFALALGAPTPLVVPPLLLLALDRIFVRREEAYLARRFGGEYEAYRSRVRRWL